MVAEKLRTQVRSSSHGTTCLMRRLSCGFDTYLLEKHDLTAQILETVNVRGLAKGLLCKAGTLVGATIIAAPSSTKNQRGERDPEMHSTQKSNQWHFGMKAHIGVAAESRQKRRTLDKQPP